MQNVSHDRKFSFLLTLQGLQQKYVFLQALDMFSFFGLPSNESGSLLKTRENFVTVGFLLSFTTLRNEVQPTRNHLSVKV